MTWLSRTTAISNAALKTRPAITLPARGHDALIIPSFQSNNHTKWHLYSARMLLPSLQLVLFPNMASFFIYLDIVNLLMIYAISYSVTFFIENTLTAYNCQN